MTRENNLDFSPLCEVASSVGRGRPVAPPWPGFDPRVERISGPWGKKNSLVVLAARLGSLGHGSGFGGFFAAGRSRVASS